MRRSDQDHNFIDTAWFYGPFVANRLIFEALHPYPRDLVIATKLGSNSGVPLMEWLDALVAMQAEGKIATSL